MSIATELELTPEVIFPPSDIYSDEPPLETELHLRQIIALWQSIEWLWRERNDFYVAGNLTIYYSPHQLKSQDFRGPDIFVVLGTERKTRKSWVVWAENGQYPNVIIEILSPTTASTDKNLKKEIYQNIFRTPDYFWFDSDSLELAGFHLVDGKYQPISGNIQGYLWSEQLGLFLGLNEGVLRFFTLEGELVLIPQETAIEEALKATQAEQRAQLEAQKATQAQFKAERLAAKLRELNIDPDTL